MATLTLRRFGAANRLRDERWFVGLLSTLVSCAMLQESVSCAWLTQWLQSAVALQWQKTWRMFFIKRLRVYDAMKNGNLKDSFHPFSERGIYDSFCHTFVGLRQTSIIIKNDSTELRFFNLSSRTESDNFWLFIKHRRAIRVCVCPMRMTLRRPQSTLRQHLEGYTNERIYRNSSTLTMHLSWSSERRKSRSHPSTRQSHIVTIIDTREETTLTILRLLSSLRTWKVENHNKISFLFPHGLL